MGTDRRTGYRRPSRRPLRIYALDPMRVDRGVAGFVTPVVTLNVPYEDDLKPGPRGRRLEVVDYDGVHDTFYQPIDLDDEWVLIRDGLPPSETDPRFHQQMVYAVISSVWQAFETALGRRINLGSKQVLRVFPHAFYGENAYYDSAHGALLFGYFQADMANPGPNVPGQWVFTCVSHDIIVHEATHALVDRLRPGFMVDSNPDVLAFHEGFADLVAIFQHFQLEDVLAAAISDSRGNVSESEVIVGLARQFGYSTAGAAPLRTAGGEYGATYGATTEPHERGSLLVAEVFDAYQAIYTSRIQDLLRLATGGSGVLPDGALHPDLVARLAREAASTAQQFFDLCIRAFDYLPPIDVQFEDFLRAMVTVDLTLSPSDDSLRVAIIEGFRRRGIFPTTAGTLGAANVGWALISDQFVEPVPVPAQPLLDVITDLDRSDYTGTAHQSDYFAPTREAAGADSDSLDAGPWAAWAAALHGWAGSYCELLGLAPHSPFEAIGFHPTMRLLANGRASLDIVVQFGQRRDDLAFPGFVPYAACTVVADSQGQVRHVITKPLASLDEPGETALSRDGQARLRRLRVRLDDNELEHPEFAYRSHVDDESVPTRLRVSFAGLHALRGQRLDDDALD